MIQYFITRVNTYFNINFLNLVDYICGILLTTFVIKIKSHFQNFLNKLLCDPVSTRMSINLLLYIYKLIANPVQYDIHNNLYNTYH